MPILTIRNNKRQETVSVPKCSLTEQTRTFFGGIKLMRRHVLALKKDSD